jgi:hypothetical protein
MACKAKNGILNLLLIERSIAFYFLIELRMLINAGRYQQFVFPFEIGSPKSMI